MAKSGGKLTLPVLVTVAWLLLVQLAILSPPAEGWLERSIHREFTWFYGWKEWHYSVDIPVDWYVAYAMIPLSDRMREAERLWEALVTVKDPYLQQIAEDLKSMAKQEGYDTYDTANLVLAFVQSLPYVPDEVSTPYDEFPKFPLETIVEGGGDCEDTSILYVTLMKILGYDVALIGFPGHMMAAVHTPDRPHLPVYVTLSIRGRDYYPAETTGEGWRIGELPGDFSGVSSYAIFPTGGALEPRPINIQKLYDDYKALQKKYEELSQEYNTLQQEHLALQNDHELTLDQLQQLQAKYDSLSEEHKEVKNQLAALQKDYSNLSIEYQRLKEGYASLNAKYEGLKNSHEQLLEQYSELEAAYEQATQELSTTKTTMSAYATGFYATAIGAIALFAILLIRGSRKKDHQKERIIRLLRRLEELRKRGALSDEEYEEKKTLLARKLVELELQKSR